VSKNIPEDICKESVFERVYNSLGQDLHNFLYYKFGSQINVDDKAQEAFIKLWDNCKTVHLSKAKSFLFTVANNLVLNELKHQKVVLKHQQESPKNYTYETPEFILEKEQFAKRYQNVLESLTEEQRVAFLLSKVEGKTHKEIAQMLNITQKVVEYRIYSAFNILKDKLEAFRKK
jgi:RNA polymerase sigma-70 factor (ECF subfamily)